MDCFQVLIRSRKGLMMGKNLKAQILLLKESIVRWISNLVDVKFLIRNKAVQASNKKKKKCSNFSLQIRKRLCHY